MLGFLRRLLAVDDSAMEDTFSLGERPPLITPGEAARPGRRRRRQGQGPGRAAEGGELLSTSLEENRRRLESAFYIPPNADMVVRPFAIGTRPPLRAVAAYMQGLAKRDIINHAILTSMMQLAHLDPMPLDRRQFMGEIACRWLPGDEVKPLATWPQVIDEIVFGATVVLVEGSGRALSVDAQGRPVPP